MRIKRLDRPLYQGHAMRVYHLLFRQRLHYTITIVLKISQSII
jgi:hypothetical protein